MQDTKNGASGLRGVRVTPPAAAFLAAIRDPLTNSARTLANRIWTILVCLETGKSDSYRPSQIVFPLRRTDVEFD